MRPSLNSLIAASMAGEGELEQQLGESAAPQVEAPAAPPRPVDTEISKLASVLRFAGTHGVMNLVKEAGASDPPPGVTATQASQQKYKQVPAGHGSPPMAPKATGAPDDDEGQRPGGGQSQKDTTKQGKGSSHPSLASNAAAIAFTKKDRSRHEAPALSQILDAKPFADNRLKENLTHTETDPNIKVASTQLALVQAEIARRTGQGGEA